MSTRKSKIRSAPSHQKRAYWSAHSTVNVLRFASMYVTVEKAEMRKILNTRFASFYGVASYSKQCQWRGGTSFPPRLSTHRLLARNSSISESSETWRRYGWTWRSKWSLSGTTPRFSSKIGQCIPPIEQVW